MAPYLSTFCGEDLKKTEVEPRPTPVRDYEPPVLTILLLYVPVSRFLFQAQKPLRKGAGLLSWFDRGNNGGLLENSPETV